MRGLNERLIACRAGSRWLLPVAPISPTRRLNISILTLNISAPVRSASRKSTSSSVTRSVAQGALPKTDNDTSTLAEDEPVYPTVMQQALNNMRKFSHCVVLTRVGNFYELYFHQADEYAPLLGLKLAKKKTMVGTVAFSGFPYFQLDKFLKVLVQDMNKYVAISEEFANDASSKVKTGLLFDRRVTRIITPGTLIDEKFMDPWENNFLLSIHPTSETSVTVPEDGMETDVPKQELGLAWLDLSSGDFFTQKIETSSLPSAIARIYPREIVMDQSFQNEKNGLLAAVLKEGAFMITYHQASDKDAEYQWRSQYDDYDAAHMDSFSGHEVAAGGVLLDYVRSQFFGALPRLRLPLQRQDDEFMMIDKNSLKALEIRETLRDGAFEGSLLQTIRRTVTKSGTRLLSRRLMSPSASVNEINERLDLVTEMLAFATLRQDIMNLLRTTFDTWRLLQKFSFSKGVADDLVSLAQTVQTTANIRDILMSYTDNSVKDESSERMGSVNSLVNRLELNNVVKLSEDILEAIDQEQLSQQHSFEDDEAAATAQMAEQVLKDAGEGEKLPGMPQRVRARLAAGTKEKDTDFYSDVWIMRPSASKSLQTFHNDLSVLLERKDELCEKLRKKSGASGMLLKWSPGLGYHVYIKGKGMNLDKLEDARRVSSSKSTAAFHVPDWTRLGSLIEEAKQRIRVEEQTIFGRLRDQVIKNLVVLRRNATVLDELDVACSFATLAEEQHLIRPILTEGTKHHIVGGRHPTVETGLRGDGRKFTSNNCFVGDQHRMLLITGPNMAGKSTYLRQNALISILAQTGSFVPAEYASIGIVDKIFSRVGSADNLFQDQSTFMVEMLETAEILKHATPRSFVIMDEVGRGTTPEDGIAVGFAALHHLYHINRSRTLFATHFHALADMTSSWDELACYCTDVVEQSDGSFAYSHRLRQGVNRESHALKVAQMAGLPKEALEVARGVLEQMKNEEMSEIPVTKPAAASGF